MWQPHILKQRKGSGAYAGRTFGWLAVGAGWFFSKMYCSLVVRGLFLPWEHGSSTHGISSRLSNLLKCLLTHLQYWLCKMLFDVLTRITSSRKKNEGDVRAQKAVQPPLCCNNFLTWRETVFAIFTRNWSNLSEDLLVICGRKIW